jgi:NAD-dependent dihydropyrimidine dehydrogenase PreA subunit
MEELAVSALRYLSNVGSLRLDEAKCTGCGMCATVCPHAVFVIDQKRARIADRDACMECGACAKNCAAEAISVEAGVGCAVAVIKGALAGTGPDCGCSCDSSRGE